MSWKFIVLFFQQKKKRYILLRTEIWKEDDNG